MSSGDETRKHIETAETQLRQAVRSAAAGHYVPSLALRQRVMAAVSPRPRRHRSRWRWTLAAATAALVLALSWWRWAPRVVAPMMLSEAVDMHVTALASAHPLDVVSTDQHTVKPWFEGRLPFAVNPPDVGGSAFTLLGGRLVYLEQAPGAALLVAYGQHRLSVFIFQDRPAWSAQTSSSGPQRYATYWIDTWDQNGLRYLVVGDTSAVNVMHLSDLVERAAGP